MAYLQALQLKPLDRTAVGMLERGIRSHLPCPEQPILVFIMAGCRRQAIVANCWSTDMVPYLLSVNMTVCAHPCKERLLSPSPSSDPTDDSRL